MNQSNNILNELMELSPTLAAIPKRNVFSVPNGYFDQLPTLLLLQTKPINEKAAVPEGYFENLADNIMARIKQEDLVSDNEHSDILKRIGNRNIYTVPVGYFDQLANNILGKLFNEPSEVLAKIGNKNVFTVPTGYFENIRSSIISAIKNENAQEETFAISQLVAGIGNKNVFSVPTGYFETLATNTQNKINQPGKIVKLGVRKTIIKYAAAAVVTGLIATGGLFIYKNNKTGKPSAETIQLMAAAKEINKTNSFDKELNTISDADIVHYLEDKGQDVNAALVASLTDDDKKLPDAADYIIDESTLDDMLKELDLNN